MSKEKTSFFQPMPVITRSGDVIMSEVMAVTISGRLNEMAKLWAEQYNHINPIDYQKYRQFALYVTELADYFDFIADQAKENVRKKAMLNG